MQDVDIVVVGAGSSGLVSAKVLRAGGLTFKVFETATRQAVAQLAAKGIRRNQH